MADYIFHVDGPEIGRVDFSGTAFVYDLSVFDTTDYVWAMKDFFSSCTLAFEIGGDIDIDLTSYPDITGFSKIQARSATGDVHLTLAPGTDEATAESLTNGSVVLDASAVGSTVLWAKSGGSNVLIGGAGNDELRAESGTDVLRGGAGADTLGGGAGADVLYGGAGADRLSGGDGIDLASYFTGSTGVVVNLVNGVGSGGDAQGDSLYEIENLSGSQGNDSLAGDSGDNALQGWNGNDVLIGGRGRDVLTGGAGADRFVYNDSSIVDSPVGAGADRISDFSHAQGDKIELWAIDADTTIAGDQAFSFIGTALYSGVAGQLRFHSNGIITTIAGDVDGDGTSDFHIQLAGAIGLVASDFVL